MIKGEAERAGTVHPREEEALTDLVNVYRYLMGDQRGQSRALLSGAQRQDKRQWGQTEAQEAPSEHQETFFHCEHDQALEQIAEGGCGVSICGDIQKPTGHSPGQLALGGPA